MKAFFSKLGAFLTAVRVWAINIFTLLIIVALVVSVSNLLRAVPEPIDPTDKVLIIAPEGEIIDQEIYASDLDFPLLQTPEQAQIQTRDLVRMIRAAADDDQLAGVLLDFSKASFAGPTTALEVARELGALRESGKPVIAHSEALGTGSYLMAAQADEIFVHPSGAVAITGLGGYRDYTRELTDKLKITMHNYSQGDFKSAVESRTRNDMSEPDRLQREELIGPIWDEMKLLMAESRGLEVEAFQTMADAHPLSLFTEASYSSLEDAQASGIIDGTKSYPELRAYMIERFGRDDSEKHKDTYPHITWDAYASQIPAETNAAKDAVAVVFVQGAITTGKQGPGIAGSHDIAALLRKAHEHSDTRALVMRVNSPGGSIIASDMIRDEIVAARGKGMPVFVSMGDVAASGGVWVSTPANAIYAQPSTITGSIGVAVAFPTFENLFEYIGVSFDGVTTTENGGWSPVLPVNEKLDAYFARWAGSAYDRFLSHVASDLDEEVDYIRSIAGGRVWVGSKALELGLVDEIGDLEATIAAAASEADIEDYRVNYVTKDIPPYIALLRSLGRGVIGPDASASYQAFGEHMARLMDIVAGINRPTPTVMCTVCMVEVL